MQVAGVDLAEQAANAETAGMPRERARMAAWPVAPPASVRMPAISWRSKVRACDGRISGATRMTGSSRRQEVRLLLLQGQLGEDAADHVAQVGHALLQIRIGDLA